MDVRIGKLKGFRGNWMCGLGVLVIEDSEAGGVEEIPCENAPTVRALEGCFGNVIGDEYVVKPNKEAGYYDKEVYWSLDEVGVVFEAFTPVGEASKELVALFEKERVY